MVARMPCSIEVPSSTGRTSRSPSTRGVVCAIDSSLDEDGITRFGDFRQPAFGNFRSSQGALLVLFVRVLRQHLLPASYPADRLDALRQARHGGLLEDALQRQLDLEGIAQARDHLRGQQTVPAQREEVVLYAHARYPQHLGVDA